MIVDQHLSREVYTSGKNETAFTADMSGAAFMAISDDVYQHKVAAIIRELSCNAYDAHLEAEKEDVPFTVKLPSILDPTFYIEDYGIGLDDNGIYTVFTVYFKSLKRKLENAIGFYGLGAKTPFAYTDNFSIIARKDGIERSYLAFFGEDSVPRIKFLSENKTENGNGLKISFTVKPDDIEHFKNEAEFILSFMPTKPEVIGASDFKFFVPDVQEQLEKKGFVSFCRYSESSLYNMHGSYVLMGHVCYPVNIHSRQFYSSNSAVAIPVKNGRFKPALSRESLTLRDDTLNEIENIFDERSKEYKKRIQDGVSAQPTFKDAILHALSFGVHHGHLDSFSYKKRKLDTFLKHDDLRIISYSSRGTIKIRDDSHLYSRVATMPVNLFVNDDGLSKSLFRKSVRKYVDKNYTNKELYYMYDKRGVSELRIKRVSALLMNQPTVFRISDIRETVERERNFQKRNLKQKTKQTVFGSVVGKYSISGCDNVEILDGVKYYELTRDEYNNESPLIHATICFLDHAYSDSLPIKLILKRETKKHSFPKFWEVFDSYAKEFIETLVYLTEFLRNGDCKFKNFNNKFCPFFRGLSYKIDDISLLLKMESFKEEKRIIDSAIKKLTWLESVGVAHYNVGQPSHFSFISNKIINPDRKVECKEKARADAEAISTKLATFESYLENEEFILKCIDDHLTKEHTSVKLAA